MGHSEMDLGKKRWSRSGRRARQLCREEILVAAGSSAARCSQRCARRAVPGRSGWWHTATASRQLSGHHIVGDCYLKIHVAAGFGNMFPCWCNSQGHTPCAHSHRCGIAMVSYNVLCRTAQQPPAPISRFTPSPGKYKAARIDTC